MASLMTLVVLCPNGRKQSVKVTPNTSILEVLEEACKRQGINSEDYDINHYSKRLDLSLSVRFANLPNNALLELNPAKYVRKESTITVGLQLESGERLMGDFNPSSSVWDVLNQCLISRGDPVERADAIGEPICVYMRKKLTGDEIKKTTLRSLGLTSGKAIIRLLYRQPEELTHQAHVASPLEKPFPISQFEISDVNVDDSGVDQHARKQPRLDLETNEKSNLGNSEQSQLPEFQNSNVEQCESKQANDSQWDICGPVPITTNYMQLENTFSAEDPTSCLGDQFQSSVPDVKKEMRPDNDCEVMEYHDSLVCSEQGTKEIGEINYIGPRNAVLFNLEDIKEVKKVDFSDEFFELTINDVRYLMDNYKKTRYEIENQPLMLNSQREAKFLHQLALYKQSVIRIYFPDKLALQGTFIAEETVQSVIEFVRNFLEDKDLDFYLYVAPPKSKLLPENTLLEARLIPAAVVYFGCDVQYSSYLRPAVRNQVSDPRAAGQAAAQSRQKSSSNTSLYLPTYDSNEAMASSSMTAEVSSLPSTSGVRNMPIRPTSTDKIPKWLKLSKK